MQVEMQPSINKPFVLIQKQIWQFSVKLCKKSSKRGIFRAFWNHIKNQHFLILPSLCIDENWFFLLGLNNTSAKIIAKNLRFLHTGSTEFEFGGRNVRLSHTLSQWKVTTGIWLKKRVTLLGLYFYFHFHFIPVSQSRLPIWWNN